MTPENRNLIMAVALSMIVLLGWQMLVIQPEMEREAAEQERIAAEMAKSAAEMQATGQPTTPRQHFLESQKPTPRAPAQPDKIT